MKYFQGIILVLLIIGCTKTENDNIPNENEKLLKDHEIIKPQIVVYRKERKVINVTSEKLAKNNNEDALLSGNVVADFFDDDGNHTSLMLSDSAMINEGANNFEAFSNVVVISDSGLTLRTEKLFWDNRYKLITSKDSVLFTTESKDTLQGIGFESDMDLSNWKILKPTGVTGRVIK
ncbi:MAG: LPS export ABC transporter periplasmic protein LptC [Candidatus Marinimicrobia bacterium]|nr:LPS export ABC transporter periplasmic protein LptC [Candidatus Neomarinimicrobiota bacterium]MBL7109755.1 LPS export ABC transporter periplasmic protein LptC [Candidatus Neomarinimicrobiota bacterium]